MTSEKIIFTHNTCHFITKHVKKFIVCGYLGTCLFFGGVGGVGVGLGGFLGFFCIVFFIFLLLLFGFFVPYLELWFFFQSISQTFASLFSINMSKILVKSQGKNNNWLEIPPPPPKNHFEKNQHGRIQVSILFELFFTKGVFEINSPKIPTL